MDDWRYDLLREDLNRIRKEMRDLEKRTCKVENWQFMLPLRVTEKIMWLTAAGVTIFVFVEAVMRS